LPVRTAHSDAFLSGGSLLRVVSSDSIRFGETPVRFLETTAGCRSTAGRLGVSLGRAPFETKCAESASWDEPVPGTFSCGALFPPSLARVHGLEEDSQAIRVPSYSKQSTSTYPSRWCSFGSPGPVPRRNHQNDEAAARHCAEEVEQGHALVPRFGSTASMSRLAGSGCPLRSAPPWR
jgi:hypothetical protein